MVNTHFGALYYSLSKHEHFCRHATREVHSRKRRHDDKKRSTVRPEVSKELTFPVVATQKCLSLLEFVEKRVCVCVGSSKVTKTTSCVCYVVLFPEACEPKGSIKKNVCSECLSITDSPCLTFTLFVWC